MNVNKNSVKLTTFSAKSFITLMLGLFTFQKSFTVPYDTASWFFTLAELFANVVLQVTQIAVNIVKTFLAFFTFLVEFAQKCIFLTRKSTSIALNSIIYWRLVYKIVQIN